MIVIDAATVRAALLMTVAVEVMRELRGLAAWMSRSLSPDRERTSVKAPRLRGLPRSGSERGRP